jgi:hypothetical protein
MLFVLMFASITSASTALSISTAKLPAATVSQPFSAVLAASGGTAPYSWSVNKPPAGLTITKAGVLSGTPATAGCGSLQFTVKDSKNKTASKALTLSVAKAPALPVATLKSSLASPVSAGSAITFTAGMTNGSGTYEYQFMYVDPLYPTLLLTAQPYSSVSSWTLNTSMTPYAVGSYAVTVYVRKVGSLATYDYSTSQSISVVPPPAPTGLSLTPSLTSPQESSKHIQFVASTATGSAYAQFEFSITYPDGSVHHFYPQGEIPTATFIGSYEGGGAALWNTFGLPAGNYVVSVYQKTAFSTAAYDLVKSMTYTLTPSSIVLPPTDPAKYGKVLYEKGTEANPAGNYYVFSDTSTSKFDAEWNLIWKIAGTGGNPAFDKDGNIVMYAGGFKKIDTNGNILSSWNAGLSLVLSSVDATFIDADNNVYVAGRKSPGGSTTVHVLKYDAAGALQWDWTASPDYVVEPTGCHNGAYVVISGLSVDADGRIHLSGATRTLNERFVGVVGPFFMTFDATGNQLSNVSIPSGGGKLFKDGQGNYVTIGTEVIAGTNPAMNVTKFDADGAIIWQKFLASNTDLLVRDYIQDAFGNLYLLSSYMPLPGTPKVVSNQYDRVVVTKIDAEGNKVVAFTGGTTPEEWIYGMAVSADDLGNLFVKTSTTLPAGAAYRALMKFNAEGMQEWLK